MRPMTAPYSNSSRDNPITSTRETNTMPTTDPESVPRKEESNVDPDIVRWIPLVPLAALMVLFVVYIIYAEILAA